MGAAAARSPPASPGALARRLIDHEIVARIARELGVTDAAAAVYDEQRAGGVARFLGLLAPLGGGGIRGAGAFGDAPTGLAIDEHQFHDTLRRVVEAAAGAGRVVIVGRGAQVLLAARRDVLRVRVVAPLPLRRAYVARREGLTDAAALARIARKERDRARYLRGYYHRRPDDPQLYDLVVNTGVLALDSAVELAVLALEHKARQLALAADALGPVAGLGALPGPGRQSPAAGGCRRAAAAGVTPGPLGRLFRGFRAAGSGAAGSGIEKCDSPGFESHFSISDPAAPDPAAGSHGRAVRADQASRPRRLPAGTRRSRRSPARPG